MSPLTLQGLCVESSLYQPIEFESAVKDQIYGFLSGTGTIDAYCLECNAHSVFTKADDRRGWDQFIADDNQIKVFRFHCSRNNGHRIFFAFRYVHASSTVTKIGQFPSVADLADPDLRKYRPILGKRYSELTRAVGLAAHGVGVGSFIYLRRIFEHLIEEARTKASTETAWNEADYQKARMDEKIQLLRSHLPEFLYEQRKVYSILSVGVHTLSEEDCLNAFETVKLGIELILDEKLQQFERDKKVKEAAASLAKLHSTTAPKQPTK